MAVLYLISCSEDGLMDGVSKAELKNLDDETQISINHKVYKTADTLIQLKQSV